MAKVPHGVDPEQLTIVARRVLLDGLEALSAHRDAITVVGAQAVYLRSPDAAVRSAAFTSDGDLTLDPARLPDRPLLDEALRNSGFELLQADQPGLWRARSASGSEPYRWSWTCSCPRPWCGEGGAARRSPRTAR